MNMMDFVKPELLILVPVLYMIGVGIKKSNVKDNLIPAILGLCGVFLAIVWVTATTLFATYQDFAMACFVAITQGILCAGLSVYCDQLIKQGKKGGE